MTRRNFSCPFPSSPATADALASMDRDVEGRAAGTEPDLPPAEHQLRIVVVVPPTRWRAPRPPGRRRPSAGRARRAEPPRAETVATVRPARSTVIRSGSSWISSIRCEMKIVATPRAPSRLIIANSRSLVSTSSAEVASSRMRTWGSGPGPGR